MPAPTITINVTTTSNGRRAFREQVEQSVNAALEVLYDEIMDIPAGSQGERGPDGRSAYEVAVAGGFIGTESQWLASLHGTDGTDGESGLLDWSKSEWAIGINYIVNDAVTYEFPVGSGAHRSKVCVAAHVATTENGPEGVSGTTYWRLLAAGSRGSTGATGNDGTSIECVEFATDTAAQAYATANPLAIVISTEGM